jgi:hypothetical protein
MIKHKWTVNSNAHPTWLNEWVYILFIVYLTMLSVSQTIQHWMRGWYWKWIEKDVEGSGRGLIQGTTWHLPGGTEENHEKTFSHDSQSPGWDLNPGPPEYEAGVLTSRPWHSVSEYLIDMQLCDGICKLVNLSLLKIIYTLQEIKT